MAEISGETGVPLGRAGTGAAYILGNHNPSALALLAQGQRARQLEAQRAAALKLKQDQDAAKALDDRLKYGTKGGAFYQDALNTRAFQGIDDRLVEVGRAESKGAIDHFSARQKQAEIIRAAEDERTLSEAKQKEGEAAYNAVRADKLGRDATAWNVGYQGSLTKTNPDGTIQRLLPSEHDHLAAIQEQDNNPYTYVVPEQIRRHVQGWQASTLADAQAGHIGGTNSAHSLTYKGVVVEKQPDGSYAPRMRGGRPVVDVTQSDLDQARSGSHELDMSVKRMELEDAKLAAQQGRPAKDALTLYKEALQPYVSFREVEHSGLNRLPPQPKSAGKEKGFVPDDGSLVDGEYSASIPAPAPDYAGLKDDRGQPIGYDFSRPAAPQKGFEHLGQGKQPILKTASGDLKEKHTDAIKLANYYTEDGRGNFSEVTNNVTPQAGVFGPSTVVAVDTKTGKPLFSKSREEQKQLIASGQARPQLFIDLAADKNEKFAADKSRVLKDLITANNDASNLNKKSQSELEDQATKIVSKGVTRHFIPYNAQNAQQIDPVTGGHYRAALKTMLAKYKVGATSAATAPTAKADPLNFAPKATPKAAAPKPKANPLGF